MDADAPVKLAMPVPASGGAVDHDEAEITNVVRRDGKCYIYFDDLKFIVTTP